MTIDLSKLKPGDKVKLRCGGEHVVEYARSDKSDGTVFVGGIWYKNDGKALNQYIHLWLDIIAIEPKPEPRKVVQYVGLWRDCLSHTYANLEDVPSSCSKYYRITIVENEPPVIEEVE